VRWLVAPLIAALFFLGSGWLNALERTTEQSAALAATSEEAPKETAAAAESVSSLPTIAELTEQQADGFRALVDALQLSAQRVRDLNATIEDQRASLETLHTGLGAFRSPIRCVEQRLRLLVATSDGIPRALGTIEATIGELSDQQKRSLRHLRSINRKMTALGVVATATDVRPPPRPPEAGPPRPGDPRRGRSC
jgi:chromosome segregation ATPase